MSSMLPISFGNEEFDAQLAAKLEFDTNIDFRSPLTRLAQLGHTSSAVDSFTSRSEYDSASATPSILSQSSSILQRRHRKHASKGEDISQEGSNGILQRVRRTSTNIKSILHGRTSGASGSISSKIAPYVAEKENDSPRTSSSNSVADLALRCRNALVIGHPPRRDTPQGPPHMSQHPNHGAAARAAAASANRSSGCELKRNDSNVALSCGDGHRESGIKMSGEQAWAGEGRERRGSRVSRKDPLSCLPLEIATLIFTHLSATSLAHAVLVNKQWSIVASDKHVWRRAFLDQFEPKARSHPLPLAVGGSGAGKTYWEQDWKKMFKARAQIEKNWKQGEPTAVYLNGHTDSVYCVQYDENIIITGSRDRTFRIWDINTYACLKVIGIPSAYQTDLRDNALPITRPNLPISSNILPKPARKLSQSVYHTPTYYHDASILCLQFDAEIMVTGSSDCSLIVWDRSTWQPIHKLESHTAGVLDIAFDKEKIVSCSKDATLCVWDRLTGALLQRITGHMGPVNAVQLRGNLVISAAGEGCARLWNLNFQPRRRRSSFTSPSPPSRSTSSTDPNYTLPTCDAKCVKEFWSKDRGLACVEFSDDGKYVLAGGNDQVIYKFDTQSGRRTEFAKGHDNLVRSLYLDEANGRVISGSYDSSLRVWDFGEGAGAGAGERRGAMSGWAGVLGGEGVTNEGVQEERVGAGGCGRELRCFPHWTNSWMLSAKCDYRRIVCTSQDGRALILDFGDGVEGSESLRG